MANFPGFGARVKQAREALGLTQLAVARAVGKTSSAMTRWEKQSHIPERATLGRLAEVLHVPMAWLLLGEDAYGEVEALAHLRNGTRGVGRVKKVKPGPSSTTERGPARAGLTALAAWGADGVWADREGTR